MALLCLAGRAEAAGRIWRVSKDGSGDYTTIQACINAMAPGDTCLVSAGTYNERLRFPGGKSGTAGAPTIIKSETALGAKIWGGDTAGCNYLVIQGFDITSPTSASGWTDGVGVWINSSNVELLDNYLHDIHYPAISGTGNNVHVSRNHIYRMGIGINLSGSNWLVESNDLERVTKYAEMDDADYVRFFGDNHVIRNNHLFGALSSEIGAAHVDGFQTFDDGGDHAQHIVIEGNLLEGYYHQGLMLEAAFHNNSFDLSIRNNIFISPQTYAVAAADKMREVKVYNNVVINPAIFAVRFLNGGSGEAKNNIFYSTLAAGAPAGDILEQSYSADSSSSVVGANNLLYFPNKTISQSTFPNDIVNANPMFVNLSGYNLHLNPGSPAVDRALTISSFNQDRDGVTRPQGSAWDIGPYELVSGPVDTTPPTVALTVPTANAVISNLVTLSASASDNAGGSGVASVSFLVDGQVVGSSGAAPYSCAWDSHGAANGAHTFTARATDNRGNQATSSGVNATVTNSALTLVNGLVGYWPLDDSGATATDASGNGNNGTPLNGAGWGVGKTLGCISLDGTNDYLRVPSQTALEQVTNAVTVCAWVKINPNNIPTGDFQSVARKVLNENANPAPYSAYDLVAQESGGVFRPRMGVTRADSTRVTALGATHAYGTWCHLAGVYDGSAVRIYVNGVEEASAPFTGSIIQAAGQPLCIGRYGTVAEPMKGQIDDFRLYNRALSPAEIANLYIQQPFRIAAGVVGGNKFVLQWPSTPGTVYRIEFKDSPDSALWTSLGADLTATSTNLSATNPISASPMRCFRVSTVGNQ